MAQPVTELVRNDRFHAFVKLSSSQDPVPIYAVSVNEQLKKTTGYIEAKDGEQFTVHYRDDGRSEDNGWDWTIRVYIDGSSVRGKVLLQTAINQSSIGSKQRMVNFTGALESESSERPFVFSKPTLAEDPDDATTSEVIVKGAGTIKVTLQRGYFQGPSLQTVIKTPLKEPVFSEKSKKGMMSHISSFGESKSIERQKFVHVDDVDTSTNPWWSFEFRYLSRVLLELQGHVEAEDHSRSPSVEAVASSSANNSTKVKKEKEKEKEKGKKRKLETIVIGDSDDDDDEDEIRRLKARLAKLEDKGKGKGKGKYVKPKVKAEKTDVKVREEKTEGGKTLLVIDD
ncbi:hypothetical protein T439DRAFT_377084 [Meredithblackwellia eburnea MCA 4105]